MSAAANFVGPDDGQPVPRSNPHAKPPARCPRGCARHHPDTLRTTASAITLVRTLAAVALALLGLRQGSDLLLGAALATHWAGDIADGLVARWRDQETVVGAVLDICADRLCVAVIYLSYVALHPEFGLALAVYLVEFMLVDSVLSLWFLRWPIAGPNYFDRVDPLVWRWNWWPPAKAVNSAVPALLSVALGEPLVALVAAALLLVVKVWSLQRALGLPVDRTGECHREPFPTDRPAPDASGSADPADGEGDRAAPPRS